MKILIVNYEYPPLGGGGGVATEQLAAQLAARHQVHILTSWHLGLPLREVTQGVQIHRVSVFPRRNLPTATFSSMISFVLVAFFKGLSLARKNKYDVINAQFVIPSGIPAALIAKLTKTPFVLSFIGGDVYDPSKFTSPHRHAVLRWLVKAISEQATDCTAISSDTAKNVRKYHGVQKNIVVTPLGIDEAQVDPVSRDILGLPQDKQVLVSIARLIPRKNYSLLLKALSKLPEMHLAIIGDGPMLGTLQQEASELGVKERVYFMGFLSESRKQLVLQSADIYISTSDHEGFGLIFLEAMKAGLPIVTTNHGGQKDFLREEVNALLVPVGDVKSLIAALQRLNKDPELREKMSARNRIDVKDYYWNGVTKKLEVVLKQAYESSS